MPPETLDYYSHGHIELLKTVECIDVLPLLLLIILIRYSY